MSRILAVLGLCVMFVFACGKKQEESKPNGLSKETLSASHDLVQGKKVFEENCAACHKAGMMGAPKPGEKVDWAPRIGQGIDVLIKKSISGYEGKTGSMMPAKGGNQALSDQEVGNAVAFMVSESL
jgi:cytochrome c5